MTTDEQKRKQPLIRWLPPMKQVLYALVPAAVAAVFFFGWRALFMISVVMAAGFFAEWLFARTYNQPVNSSVFVTGALLSLSLPPTLPVWMGVIGVVFAVVFGKMVFGGFGKNPFNPAMVGRAFIYVTFAGYMSGSWATPFPGAAGGLLSWTPDAITSATILETGGADSAFWLQAFLGYIPGSLGETSALAVLLGGVYLFWKKTANRSIIVTTALGMLVMQTVLWLSGTGTDPLTALLAGGFMLGLFFITTDPVSAPKKPVSKILYGLFIGIMTALIRTFSVWPEGMMFAILLANMFAPITDHAVTELQKRKKHRAAETSS